MTPADVARVLAKASAFDQRTIGTADVMAWHEILADAELGDALEAVTRHYRDSTERLMPVHVRRLCDEMDRQRRRAEQAARERAEGLVREFGILEREPAQAIAATADRSEELRRLLAELAEKLGPSDPSILRRREWWELERQRERAARAEPNPFYDPRQPVDLSVVGPQSVDVPEDGAA